MAASNIRRVGALFVVLAALWCMLGAQLSQHWAVEPEYSFGWLVPFLSAYLVWIRWRSRPATGSGTSSKAKWIFVVAALALFPTWVIAQPNPDWRTINWLLATETVALSLCVVYFLGGTPWLKHFAFSICLIFAAVPWPMALQETVVHELTSLSTVLTVGALHLFRIHAVQSGNIIELRTGAVGVEEACSGIQSLQAASMMALFLGELYRATAMRRTMLVLCAALIALGCNAVRTFSLAAVASQQGIEVIDKWHDPVGYFALISCFLLVWGSARAISGSLPAPAPVATATASGFPNRLIFGLGVWILLTIVGTELWYREHETTDTAQWSVAWPVHKREFADIPITKSEAASLLFSEGRGAEWSNDDGSHWVAYFFKWAKGPGSSRILAREHRPENCLPGAGYRRCGDHGIITVDAKSLSIPFHALDFEGEDGKDYVFYCLWEEGAKNSGPPRLEDQWSQLTRLRSVLLGERNLGQQTLEIVISGVENQQQAEAVFRKEVTTLIDTTQSDLVADASSSNTVESSTKPQR